MDLVKAEMHKYPNAKLHWVQEEPKNMGAWSYCRPRFEATLKKEGSGRTIKLVPYLHIAIGVRQHVESLFVRLLLWLRP